MLRASVQSRVLAVAFLGGGGNGAVTRWSRPTPWTRNREEVGPMTDTVERRGAPETVDHVVVRFAGDSGDGMQLTGDRFTSSSALFGNDLSTLPDFPAEIRAPAGTVNGVSSFQVHISDHDITTPGDAPSVLVAMNPAALMADIGRLEQGGLLIVNRDTFLERELTKVGYTTNPL